MHPPVYAHGRRRIGDFLPVGYIVLGADGPLKRSVIQVYNEVVGAGDVH